MAVRTRRVVALIALAVLLLVAGLSFPWAQPALVKVKPRLFGPQDVYESLARDDDRWGVVVAGVSRGELVPRFNHSTTACQEALERRLPRRSNSLEESAVEIGGPVLEEKVIIPR